MLFFKKPLDDAKLLATTACILQHCYVTLAVCINLEKNY